MDCGGRSPDATNKQRRGRAFMSPSVVPGLTTAQIKKAVSNLLTQYKSKDEEFESLKREYNVRPVAVSS